MAFPDIKIGSTFDAKGFKQAETASTKLGKSVKKLAGAFGLALGTKAIVNFGMASAKAFIEDDNAARSLSVTIKNLGLNYDNHTILVGRFIDNLEKQTGVLDDELRPAMDRLLRATGSVTKSQELLNLSLDIAAGTGKTVEQVSQSLQKAYLGQTQAIGRLGVGISKAELATGKFEDIQQKLTTLFAGQAASAANSYAGQLAKLQVATNNAKETIGKGLIDALTMLGDDKSIDSLNTALEDTSLYIADIIRGIGGIVSAIQGIPILGKAFQLPLDAYVQAIPVIGFYISTLANLGKEARKLGASAGRQFTGGSGGAGRDFVKEREAKAAAAKIKSDKAAANAKTKADKLAAAKQLILSKAASIFDLQKISIAAALKGKISEEEKTRLLLMQAIADEDATKAESLSKKLEEIQKKNADIAKSLSEITAATNPFEAWVNSLGAAVALLGVIGSQSTGTGMPGLLNPNGTLTPRGKRNIPTEPDYAFPVDPTTPVPDTSIFGTNDTIDQIIEKVDNAAQAAAQAADEAALSVKETQIVIESLAGAITNGSSSSFSGSTGGFGWSVPQGMGSLIPQTPTIIVNNNGTTIMQDEFIAVISDAILESQRFGYGRTPAGALP